MFNWLIDWLNLNPKILTAELKRAQLNVLKYVPECNSILLLASAPEWKKKLNKTKKKCAPKGIHKIAPSVFKEDITAIELLLNEAQCTYVYRKLSRRWKQV